MFVRLNNIILNLNNVVYIELNLKDGVYTITMCDDSEIHLDDYEFTTLYKAIKRINNERKNVD